MIGHRREREVLGRRRRLGFLKRRTESTSVSPCLEIHSVTLGLVERNTLFIGNDTGQPNPTGSRVRVSLGSGAGHGESTRDPGPTHLKGNSQRRPTKVNAGQRRPTAANEDQCRPAKTKKGYVWILW